MKMLDTPQAIGARKTLADMYIHIRSIANMSSEEFAASVGLWRGIGPRIEQGKPLLRRDHYIAVFKKVEKMEDVDKQMKISLWYLLGLFWPRNQQKPKKKRKERKSYSRRMPVRSSHGQRATAHTM